MSDDKLSFTQSISQTWKDLALKRSVDEFNRSVQSLKQSKKLKKAEVILKPSDYDPDTKILKAGDYSVSFQRSKIAATIMEIVFTPYNFRKRWTVKTFYKKHKRKLDKSADVTEVTYEAQVRRGITTLNEMVANQTKHAVFDIFIAGGGFRINPAYLPKKQR